MVSKRIACILGVSSLLACSAGGVQIGETSTLVDRESLKVVVANTFPKDMSCEINVGPNKEITYLTKGDDGRVNSARIDLGVGRPAVSLLRKEGHQTSYVLYLFLEEKPGQHLVALFDLDLDGEWDVKKTEKQYIRLGSEWVEVDQVEGITAEKTTAARGTRRFLFDKRKWIALPAIGAR
jgi:hypothetical protein